MILAASSSTAETVSSTGQTSHHTTGIRAPVTRNATIKIEAYDLDGNEITGELEGLIARIAQHETDQRELRHACHNQVTSHKSQIQPVGRYL